MIPFSLETGSSENDDKLAFLDCSACFLLKSKMPLNDFQEELGTEHLVQPPDGEDEDKDFVEDDNAGVGGFESVNDGPSLKRKHSDRDDSDDGDGDEDDDEDGKKLPKR